MEMNNGKEKLNDEMLDQVSGGVCTSVEREYLGPHEGCGAGLYRITEKGIVDGLGWEYEKTHVECERCGWISV